MTDAMTLVKLLKIEVETLKKVDPTLDAVMLDRLHEAVATDVHMDELFGPRVDEPSPDLHELLDDASTMSREVQAFMAAGIRAYMRLGAELPAA